MGRGLGSAPNREGTLLSRHAAARAGLLPQSAPPASAPAVLASGLRCDAARAGLLRRRGRAACVRHRRCPWHAHHFCAPLLGHPVGGGHRPGGGGAGGSGGAKHGSVHELSVNAVHADGMVWWMARPSKLAWQQEWVSLLLVCSSRTTFRCQFTSLCTFLYLPRSHLPRC